MAFTHTGLDVARGGERLPSRAAGEVQLRGVGLTAHRLVARVRVAELPAARAPSPGCRVCCAVGVTDAVGQLDPAARHRVLDLTADRTRGRCRRQPGSAQLQPRRRRRCRPRRRWQVAGSSSGHVGAPFAHALDRLGPAIAPAPDAAASVIACGGSNQKTPRRASAIEAFGPTTAP